MKITISTSEVIEGVYANSALRAEASQWPEGAVAAILSVDAAPALRRMAADALAAVVAATAHAAVPWQLCAADELQLSAACGDRDDGTAACTADATTATLVLRAAVTAMLIAIIWRGLDVKHYNAARDQAQAYLLPLVTAATPEAAAIAPSF